jgi:hypothetical protein
MSDDPSLPPDLDPAERRAAELLSLVATRTPSVSEQFTTELVTRARTQKAITIPLVALGHFLASLAGALYAAVGTQRRGQR